MTRPDFVYFDATYTLLHPAPTVGAIYADMARGYGIEAEPAALEVAFRTAWQWARRHAPMHPRVPYGIRREESLEFWSLVVRRCFAEAGSAEPPPEYYPAIFEHFARPATWQVYPDVTPALAMLDAAGVPWGILSNFDLRLHEVLAGHPWAAGARVVLTASEAAAEKPHEAIFHCAAERAGCVARLALVGDDPTTDAEGAGRVGWQARLVPRRRHTAGSPEAGRFADLTAAVASLLG